MTIKIDLIVGARPNFVKAAALLNAAKDFPKIDLSLVHTGQHYEFMSDPYFKDLCLPAPVILPKTICMGFEANAVDRLSQMIRKLNSRFELIRPDAVLVVGDTDSTLAGALAAAKCGIPVIHVEAGLRIPGEPKMQEEVNRRLVDAIAIKHYATTEYAADNLEREGKKGIVVGNVMVDTLCRFLPEAKRRFLRSPAPYALFTMHRAENVDDPDRHMEIMAQIVKVSKMIPICWPHHPRLGEYEDFDFGKNINVMAPMSYLHFISSLSHAKFVITDSGGVQEESSVLGVPCVTVRDSTERPETVMFGTNRLTAPKGILDAVRYVQEHPRTTPINPLYKAGSASHRIMEDICATL